MQVPVYRKIAQKVAEFRADFSNNLSCKVENLNPLREYVKAITGQDDDLTVGVLAHWCWMVKRRLNNLTVCDHIMPILYGGQGAGKSQAVERLKDIFTNYSIDVSLDTLSDNRFSKSLTEAFIGVADELSGINKADLGHLKRAITSRDVSYRIMGSNSVVSAPTTISFIGCTNLPLNVQLFDSTGSRRFYQIDCQAKMNWLAINKIDYLALWKGVDESKPTGYLHTVKTALTTAQKELTVKNEVEDFMDAQGYSVNGASTTDVVVGDLYSEYKTWCDFNGVRFPSTNSMFGRKLSALGYKRATRNNTRMITVATSENEPVASPAKQQPFTASPDWAQLATVHIK